jgi:hypothetical protein
MTTPLARQESSERTGRIRRWGRHVAGGIAVVGSIWKYETSN